MKVKYIIHKCFLDECLYKIEMNRKNELKEIGIKNRVCYCTKLGNLILVILFIFYQMQKYMKIFMFKKFCTKLQQSKTITF